MKVGFTMSTNSDRSFNDDTIYLDVAKLKRYPEYLLFDFQQMYPIIYRKAGGRIPHSMRQDILYKDILEHPHPTSDVARAYIMTASCQMLLVMDDLDLNTLNRLLITAEATDKYLNKPYSDLDATSDCSLSTTKFVFTSKGLATCCDLTARELADHLACFHHKNLVSYSGNLPKHKGL